MENTKVNFALLLLALVSVARAVDKTREEGTRGSGVVEAVVDLLRSRCMISNDNFFLRRMAYAASRDGSNSDTYRNNFHGGIWQINRQKFLITKSSKYVQKQREGIHGNFSISWSTVTWSDLRKPLFSGIAAALYLQYVTTTTGKTIPSIVNAQAKFWADNFGGQRNDFLAVRNLRDVSCDTKPIDLVFVVDESGSIRKPNFDRIKDFLDQFVEQLTISSTTFRVGLVKFHKSATTEFNLDRYSTQNSIRAAIHNMTYNRGGTLIGAGIKAARSVFTKSSRRNDSTKVMILLTDGKSSDKTISAQQAKALKDEGVSIFVIGIGNVDLDEINSVASKPTCLHVFILKKFTGITNILYEVRRRSCTAPQKVEIVGNSEPKVSGELKPDHVIEDTVEIDNNAQSTTITTEVTCGEVELFAAADTSTPNEALYEAKGLARDNQPSSFSIQNGGRTVYVHYKGKIIATTQKCLTGNKTFSIAFTQAIDECESNPCKNGATCVDLPKGFDCQCAPGFKGDTCEDKIDQCENNPCINGGQCIAISNGYKCVCITGYTGTACEIGLNRCASSPCRNNGICSNVNADFRCTCASGFSGKTCEMNVNGCQTSPCQNGGSCINTSGGYSCVCSDGYTGSNCENEVVILSCRVGSVMRECTIEDLEKANIANRLCTGKGHQIIKGPGLETTTSTSATQSTAPSSPSKCVPKGFIYHIPYPQDFAKFIQCDEFGGSTIMPCAPGTTFNKKQQICTATGNTACPSTGYEKLAYPGNSTKYYECVHGVSYLRSCSSGLVFDENSKYCTWPTIRRQLSTKENDVTLNDDEDDDDNDEEDDTAETELNEMRENEDDTDDERDVKIREDMTKLKEVLRKLLDNEE